MSASVPSLAAFGYALAPSSEEALGVLMEMRGAIDRMAETSPAEFPTEDLLHAGCYVRTCFCPAGTVLAGAIIKVPTVVVVHGVCDVTNGTSILRVDGFAVLKGALDRATVWRAHTDTYLTMVYASKAKTCGEAEEEFTDEFENRLTRRK